MPEAWVPVVGWEGFYEVSDRGRVRGLGRTVVRGNGINQTIKPRVLKSWNNSVDGHPMVVLSDTSKGKRLYAYVHSLMMEAFVGPRPEGMQVRHLNDVFDDNRLENLRYGTRSENGFDRVDNGIHNYAKRDSCKRGHLFAGPNVNIKTEGRYSTRLCKACRLTMGHLYRHPELKPQRDAIADEYYRKIMEGWSGEAENATFGG